MDKQNPRVGAELVGGRGDDRTRGLDPGETADRSGTTRTAGTASPQASGSATPTRISREGEADSRAAAGVEPRTRELRAEIDNTREELSETVNAIQERLSPANMMNSAKETVKAAAREKARDVTQSESVQHMRANPIATTMIGIGIAGVAMLAFAGRQQPSYGRARGRDRRFSSSDESSYPYSAARTSFEGVEDATSEFTDGYAAGRPWSSDEADLTPGFGARGRSWSGAEENRENRSGSRAGHPRRLIEPAWSENPLVIGAGSLVIGALVGLAVPETERENELMGETRDSVVETVQGTVREKVNKVQEAATTAVNTVKEAAGTAVGVSEGGSEERRS